VLSSRHRPKVVDATSDGRPPVALDVRLALPAVAAWLVAWQGRSLAPRVLAVLCVTAAVTGLLLMRRHAAVAAVVICAAAGGLAVAGRVEARTSGPLPGLAASASAVVVEAVITDDPRRVVARHGDLFVTRVRVQRLQSGGQGKQLRAPVLVLSSDRKWLGLLPSQRVRVEGRLRAADRGDDVAALLSGRGPPVVLSAPSVVQRVAGHLRAGLRAAVAPLPEAEQGLLPGLVVGDVSRLDPELREDFRTTGLTHLVAVSGTNVAIVLGAALLASRALGLGLVAAPAVSVLALAGFVILARPSPSVLRAAAMGLVGLAALVSGTRRSALPSLAAAVLVLVLVDPDLAAAPGFALSVLATAGLIVLAPPWRDAMSRRMPAWLATAIAVPAAAQVACGPVVVAIAGTLGLLAVPANLLAVPAVAPATVLGVLAALIAPVSVTVAQGLAWLAYLPTAWLVRVARTGAGLPGSDVGWPTGMSGGLLLAAASLCGLLLLARAGPRRLVGAGCVGVLVSVIGLRAIAPAWPPPGWAVVICDVGQGDAAVLSAGDGQAVVVDAGPDAGAMHRCLRRLHVRSVPLVLLSHLHADHIDGLPGVLRRPVGVVQIGPLDEPLPQYERVRRWAAAGRVPVQRAALGEARRLGPLRWQLLAPSRPYRGTTSDPNNSSVVLRLEVAGLRVLLTGDVEPAAQRDLLDSGQDLRADVLKVPHHGSSHQLPAFLDAVGARAVVTSVGADNSYGHPAPVTLDRLTASGARSLRTDQDGDVAVVVGGGALRVMGARGSGTTRGPLVQKPSAAPMGATAPPSRGLVGLALHPCPAPVGRHDDGAEVTGQQSARPEARSRSPTRETMQACRSTFLRP